MGYGSRALQALNSYYSGEFFNLEEETAPEAAYPDPSFVDEVKKPCSPLYPISPNTQLTISLPVSQPSH